MTIAQCEAQFGRGAEADPQHIGAGSVDDLDNLPLATEIPGPMPPLEGYAFEGFLNPDGSVGTKNVLGIATTVQCVAATVDYAVARIKALVRSLDAAECARAARAALKLDSATAVRRLLERRRLHLGSPLRGWGR